MRRVVTFLLLALSLIPWLALPAPAQDDAGEESDLPEGNIHVCPVCGNTVKGEAPDTCPICGVPRDSFIEVK